MALITLSIAIKFLTQNILAEGDMYGDDLLTNVLKSDKEHWLKNTSDWNSIIHLIEFGKPKLDSFDTVPSIKNE